MRVFFFGVGYCARRLIGLERWIEACGTARMPEQIRALRDEGIDAHPFATARPCAELVRALQRAEAIVISIPPRDQPSATLQRLGETIAGAPALERILYFSTVGVYGDHGGGG